jgi:drug/metabolite transporter (DMT)-like permease
VCNREEKRMIDTHYKGSRFAFLGMVSFNNWFLMRVGVGFYAIGKSLAIPFSVIMSYLVLKVSTSMKTIAACGVISAGIVPFVGLLCFHQPFFFFLCRCVCWKLLGH